MSCVGIGSVLLCMNCVGKGCVGKDCVELSLNQLDVPPTCMWVTTDTKHYKVTIKAVYDTKAKCDTIGGNSKLQEH